MSDTVLGMGIHRRSRLNLMEFMMERMDNFDKCYEERQVLWDRRGEQKEENLLNFWGGSVSLSV